MMPPACSTTKGSTVRGCTLPYLACFMPVTAMAVASGMWHAAGMAARATTDGPDSDGQVTCEPVKVPLRLYRSLVMASLADAMTRSSAAGRGGEPPKRGHSLSRQRTNRNISPSALQQPTRDRARDDVSPVVNTTLVEDVVLMQALEIGAPSVEIQKKVETFLAQSTPPAAQDGVR